jgi:diguanylate cyclase (GGDEF)-like protein
VGGKEVSLRPTARPQTICADHADKSTQSAQYSVLFWTKESPEVHDTQIVWRRVIPLTLALLALAGEVLYAQEYSFRSFGADEGLTNLTIRKIYQDRTGFIWVSTENGIYRYDGDRFDPFGPAQGIPSNSEAALGEGPDGQLLAGGNFGLYRLSGNRFEKLATPFKTVSSRQGIQSDGKGHTYLGTDAGLVELDSSPRNHEIAFREFPQPNGTSGVQVNGIFTDGDVLWYGCGLELCRMDAHGTRVFSRESGLPPARMLSIRKDLAGNLWVAAQGAGIFVWPAGKAKFERPSLPVPPANIRETPILDRDGRLLLPSPGGLLISDGKEWRQISRPAGLRGSVSTVYQDRQNSVWIGLGGRGLVLWRGYKEWENYSAESGLAAEYVYGILPMKDGSLWVGTGSGLFRKEHPESDGAFTTVRGFDAVVVHSLIAAPNGDVWAGTEGRGVARIQPRTLSTTWFGDAEGLTGKNVYDLRIDRENRLWAATEAGLFMAPAPDSRFSRITELPATRMWGVVQGSDGTVWTGGDSGLFEFKAGRWKSFTRDNGLSNTEVLSLGAGPNGVIWVGYQFGGGIDRIHPQAGSMVIEKNVQRAGADGMIYFLKYDASGRLWVGTQHGVDVWDGARWTHYDMNDGLVWDDCDTNGFAQGPDGAIWIGTSGGLSRFKLLPHPAPDTSLKVVFTRLSVGQNDISELANPSFGIRSKPLIARFSALNASRQNEVVFRYRLGVAGQGWTETDQRELQFAGLAPGPYRLEVQARENDGEWSGRTAEFPFRILTPWYASWWFITICVLIPLSAAGVVLRLRFLGAQEREQELVKLVAEKTADLSLANEELKKLSYTDSLTGLANRRVFDQTLERECYRVRRTNSPLSLLMIDVDHFKALNDSEGHQKGDEYLISLAAQLKRCCRRRMDTPARFGGEEFAIILADTDVTHAIEFAERVRLTVAALNLPHAASAAALFLTVSVGVATASANGCFTPEALIADADRALYAAKNAGRNRVSVAQQ